jgi:hypothetical protein
VVVLLAALYTLGVAVSLYATDLQAWGIVILFVTLVLSFLVYYVQIYQPAVALRQAEVEKILTLVFRDMEEEYRTVVPGDYTLRVNVMRLRRRFIVGPRRLRIEYFRGSFSDAELELEFLMDTGCCGTAVAENSTVWFDARENHEPYKGMSAIQRQVTSSLKSILSVPIYRPGDTEGKHPIGVIGLDSTHHVNETRFNDPNVQKVVLARVGLIGGIIP